MTICAGTGHSAKHRKTVSDAHSVGHRCLARGVFVRVSMRRAEKALGRWRVDCRTTRALPRLFWSLKWNWGSHRRVGPRRVLADVLRW